MRRVMRSAADGRLDVGRWTYYSPALLGTAVAALLCASYNEYLPALVDWQYGMLIVGICLATGLGCQLLMVAAQGAFAQVLPVPGGRSIRGGGAMLSGWLLLIGTALGFAAILLALEEFERAAWIAGGIGLAALAAAIVGYVWNWPTAQVDFAGKDG